MTELIFSLASLGPIFDHARASKETQPTFADCFNPTLAKAGVVQNKDGYFDHADLDKTLLKPSILLVKDHGAYIMSAGMPRQPREDGKEGSRVVYAAGCDPKNDQDWYDNALDICGGDDFAERIEVEEFDNLLALAKERGRKPTKVVISFIDDDKMTFGVR